MRRFFDHTSDAISINSVHCIETRAISDLGRKASAIHSCVRWLLQRQGMLHMERRASPQGELHFEETRAVTHAKPQRILRLAQVRAITGLGRSFIYQLQAQKRFPQRIKIGARAVGWLEEEVLKWVADRVAESRGDVGDDS
jgi:prophage regulatory protein